MDRVERRARVVQMRSEGFSLREIAAALGTSAATAMRDCRDGAESASEASQPSVARSEASSGGQGGLATLAAVELQMDVVYAALAAGENVPLARVRLLLARHQALSKREETCGDHMTMRQFDVECRWRDGVWVEQLEVMARRLRETGCDDVKRIIDEAMDAVAARTAAGRGE